MGSSISSVLNNLVLSIDYLLIDTYMYIYTSTGGYEALVLFFSWILNIR